MPKRRFADPLIDEYRKTMEFTLMTTRFNNETWSELSQYRIESKIPCVYSSSTPIAQSIPIDSIVFVLEMNNEINRIMGIGMVRNRIIYNRYRIFEDEKLNKFSYIGKSRIDRIDMTEEEEILMKVFDKLCFLGQRHQKRMIGIKSFPIDMLYNCKVIAEYDIIQHIINMFMKKNKDTK
jgi:hypothetical protein